MASQKSHFRTVDVKALVEVVVDIPAIHSDENLLAAAEVVRRRYIREDIALAESEARQARSSDVGEGAGYILPVVRRVDLGGRPRVASDCASLVHGVGVAIHCCRFVTRCSARSRSGSTGCATGDKLSSVG
jgi:hypothetical protein